MRCDDLLVQLQVRAGWLESIHWLFSRSSLGRSAPGTVSVEHMETSLREQLVQHIHYKYSITLNMGHQYCTMLAQV